MVFITEDMVRRRAEHNEGQICSLEELSLHQHNLERIQHLERWCRELRILYLQNNLIPKIENVGRLKKLEYLNLALNNIELIENLEGCESLQKLDLTVNFVGGVSSVRSLRLNLQLRELFLLGNPCCYFTGYRAYVVNSLPQLQWLDGKQITRSERLRASQGLEELKIHIQQQEEEYVRRREKEREEARRAGARGGGGGGEEEVEGGRGSAGKEEEKMEKEKEMEEEKEQREEKEERVFWETPCAFTPESRLEAHQHLEAKRRDKTRQTEKTPQAARTLITEDGRVLNANQPKLAFSLTEHEDSIVLDLAVFRHMDTSLLDVDVQPNYVRVSVKGKIFQLLLPSEVRPDVCSAKRSQSSGHLLVSMPKASGELMMTGSQQEKAAASNRTGGERPRRHADEGPELGAGRQTAEDPSRVVAPQVRAREGPLEEWGAGRAETGSCCEDFLDDPDVPPLI